MKIKVKQNLIEIGIKLIAFVLLVIILLMYPIESLAFSEYFNENVFNNEEETEESDNKEKENNKDKENSKDKNNSSKASSTAWANPLEVPKPITSGFGPRSFMLNGSPYSDFHTGVDLGASEGTPILAASSGTVVYSAASVESGNMLKVQREDGYSWLVVHMMRPSDLKVGDKVEIGQIVGYVGGTGTLSTGPHLHFEIQNNGQPVNPLDYVDVTTPGVSTGLASSSSSDKSNMLLSDFKKMSSSGDFFYKGVSSGHSAKGKTNFFKWIVKFLFEITDYLLGLAASVFKLGVLGFGILAEVLLSEAFDSLTVKNVGSGSYRKNNAAFYTDSKRTVNIENIIFNRVEALNVNFFESKDSVRKRLLKYSPTGLEMEELYGEDYEEEIELEDGPLLIIKDYFASLFITLYGLGLLLLLMALIINAIMAVIESVGMKKATYKERAISWAKAFVEMLLILIYMIVILQANTTIIDLLSKFADTAAESVGGTLIETDMGRNYTILETLRTRAYNLKLTVGIPATIMYIVLIWYTLKFVLMYIKRFLVVFFLSLLGPLLMIYDLIIKTLKGKSNVRIEWIKEYTFNILIQSVHAFVYLIFIPITYALASKSIVGFIIMFILLKFILEADKIIRQIFNVRGAKRHSTLDNVLEKSTLKDYATGLAVGSLFNKKNLEGGAIKKVSSAVVKPIKAVAGTVGATAFRGAYNLKESMEEKIRKKRVEAGLPAETMGEINRQKKRNKQIEEVLKLKGYSDEEIKDRMDPSGNLPLTEEEKDRIRLLERSKMIKTNKIVKGVRKAQYTSNRFKRVVKNMGTVDDKGRRRIEGREYYFDFDEKKIKLTEGNYDKFKKSVIKEFKMGKGEKGKEEYKKTIEDFKKVGKTSLKAAAGILFFPIALVDSSIPKSLYYGLLGNFQFNSKAFQQKKGKPHFVQANVVNDKVEMKINKENKKTIKNFQKNTETKSNKSSQPKNKKTNDRAKTENKQTNNKTEKENKQTNNKSEKENKQTNNKSQKENKNNNKSQSKNKKTDNRANSEKKQLEENPPVKNLGEKEK